MIHVFRRQLLRAVNKFVQDVPTWKIALFILFHYLSSWGLVLLFEAGAEYAQADTYWYFYLVTATTVGYGDFSPATLGSRLVVTIYLMPIGIAILGAIIGKVASALAEASEKVRTGKVTFHLNDHTVVVGDSSDRTINLLKNLISDNSVGEVLLLSERDSNPLNGKLAGFVSGRIEDAGVCKRACLDTAKRIIILADEDATVMGRTMIALNQNPTATIVAFFRDEEAARNLNRQTNDRVRVVTSTDMHVVVQEALDPGAATFVRQLVHNAEEETYLRMQVPSGVRATYAEITSHLIRQRVNVLALYEGDRPEMCPDPDTVVDHTQVLSVAADGRDKIDQIDWSTLNTAQ